MVSIFITMIARMGQYLVKKFSVQPHAGIVLCFGNEGYVVFQCGQACDSIMGVGGIKVNCDRGWGVRGLLNRAR